MKKIFLLFLTFSMVVPTVNAQKGINFFRSYMAGGKMLMNVDSSAKNVFYAQVFPNQPHTSFNFLPEVYNVNIQIYFRKTDSPQNYRYTILEDSKPKFVNKAINVAQLKEVDRGDEEIFRSTTFGTFPIRGKV
ncbi:MAG: sensor histidine kinase, partial [Flavobacterium sp.]